MPSTRFKQSFADGTDRFSRNVRNEKTTLLTGGLFQGHSLYVAVLDVEHVGGILLCVVSVREAVTITPYYQQEVHDQPWGHKNATKMKFPISGTLWWFLMER